MKLIDLTSTETVKVRKSSWPEEDFIEFPGVDPDGVRSHKARMISGNSSVYLLISDIDDGADDWISIEPEGPDFDASSLRQFYSDDTSGTFILPFGLDRYKGKTLDEIASTNNGLLYLDSLLARDWVWAETKETIRQYMNNPSIQQELSYLYDEDA